MTAAAATPATATDDNPAGSTPGPAGVVTEECWRDIPGYEGIYQVSDRGRVKSLARVGIRRDGTRYSLRERIRKPGIGGDPKQKANGKGYETVGLQRQGKVAIFKRVHVLVLTAFVGEAPPGTEGCHRDGKPRNNYLGNLYWGTRSDNIRDAIAHGTHHITSRTSCVNGHEYTDDNTRIDHRGARLCITCDRARSRINTAKYRARKRAA